MKARKPEPAVIEYKSMRFPITDRPSDTNIDRYIEVSELPTQACLPSANPIAIISSTCAWFSCL